MEIMRSTVNEGGLEREFSTALQTLDIIPGQRKRYEVIVGIFKAADEPQTKALAKERLKTESSKKTPEEMHAMNVEDGDTECPNCTKFGKEECWTHSSHLCGKCKKRGKTCLCVKQALYQARKKAKESKETGSEESQRRALRA